MIRDVDWLFEFLVEGALTTRWFGLGVPGQSPTNEQWVWREGWDAPLDHTTLAGGGVSYARCGGSKHEYTPPATDSNPRSGNCHQDRRTASEAASRA